MESQDFTLREMVGKGKFGRVYRAENKNPKYPRTIAVKVINKKILFENQMKAEDEIEIIEKLNSPYLIKYFTHFEDAGAVYHLYEFLPGNDMFHKITNEDISEVQAAKYMKRICKGIEYLHNNFIMHRDIKPENVLLDERGNPKIIDFSYAIRFEPNQKFTRILGTLFYLAPEMVEKEIYDYRIDIWMLGVLYYEILMGAPPFDGESSHEVVLNILDERPYFPSSLSLETISIIDAILCKNPEYRPSLKTILQMINLYFK